MNLLMFVGVLVGFVVPMIAGRVDRRTRGERARLTAPPTNPTKSTPARLRPVDARQH